MRSARDSGQFDTEDLQYLVDHVMIARTTLPARTDLNHYFEVMNSRGEQLEKHEIVKAHLMSFLANGEDAKRPLACLRRVWDACSDMSRHVQARFPAARGNDVRSPLFGNSWDDFQAGGFDRHRFRTEVDHWRRPASDRVVDDPQGSDQRGSVSDHRR